MIDLQLIQGILSIGGLALGVTYIVGGLIVNLHLSRYGVTEYQILRIKYLVVGLTYFTNSIAVFVLAAIPAVLLAAAQPVIQQIFLVASVVASVFMLWLWGQSTDPTRRTFLRSWRLWVIVGTVSAIYPVMVVVRQMIARQTTFEAGLFIAEALLAGVLSFVSQTYYYARHLYGRPSSILGSIDPIGMGIPVPVQLAGESDSITILKEMGITTVRENLTDRVLLLDETDTHYIIGISKDKRTHAVKVTKDFVKAILYLD